MIRIGITQGDINGIGYEIILKAFADARLTELFVPVVYGSLKLALAHRKMMNLQQVQFNQIPNTKNAVANKVNIINCVDDNVRLELGISTSEAGTSAFMALERATDDLKKGFIDVLVTAPINKDNIQRDDFNFPGHTEYLEAKFSEQGEQSLMILTSDNLRVALVTGHIPLSKVSESISKEKIISAAKVLNHTLLRDFRLENPKIAVLGLNPHAGENGLLGTEEIESIIPAIKELQDDKILCFGPFPSDGFFGSGEYQNYDAILAMYHDQGLIAFKSISMDSGVNYTAGLPIVRTSPAHGTAYDIAGKNLASEESFRQALYLAKDTFENRQNYDKAYANPLKKMFFDRGNDNVDLNFNTED